MGKQLTRSERIQRAREKHGDKYDYSLWGECLKGLDTVTIGCPVHGYFEQRLDIHTNGSGCQKCSNDGRTKDQIIKESKQIHGDRYLYDLVPNRAKSGDFVKFICKEHGVFEQKLSTHICNKSGCPKCGELIKAKKTSKPWKEWLNDIKKTHGDKYSYDFVSSESIHSLKEIPIYCSVHGVFHQVLSEHARRTGCPSCATHGFDPRSKAFLYILRSEEGYLKFGMSNKYKKRIKELRNKTPFSFDLLAVFEHEKGSEVSKLEKQLHKLFPSANQKGFDGATEWFIVRDLDILYFPELLGFKRVI